MTGKELKTIRERLGLSQEQFAARLKISRVSVTRMEYGSQIIKPSMAYFVELVANEIARESQVEISHPRPGRRDDAPKPAKGAGIADPKNKGRRRPRKNSLRRGRR